jgi:hypothetical protein
MFARGAPLTGGAFMVATVAFLASSECCPLFLLGVGFWRFGPTPAHQISSWATKKLRAGFCKRVELCGTVGHGDLPDTASLLSQSPPAMLPPMLDGIENRWWCSRSHQSSAKFLALGGDPLKSNADAWRGRQGRQGRRVAQRRPSPAAGCRNVKQEKPKSSLPLPSESR